MPAAPMRPSNSIDGATRRLLPRSRQAIARCAACASSPSFKTRLRPNSRRRLIGLHPTLRDRLPRRLRRDLRFQDLRELDEQPLLFRGGKRFLARRGGVICQELVEGGPQVRHRTAFSRLQRPFMLRQPMRGWFEPRPTRDLGCDIDLLPFWVPGIVVELIDPVKEGVDKLGQPQITRGTLWPVVSYEQGSVCNSADR